MTAALCYGCQDGGMTVGGPATGVELEMVQILDGGGGQGLALWACPGCIESNCRGCGSMRRELLAVLQGGTGG